MIKVHAVLVLFVALLSARDARAFESFSVALGTRTTPVFSPEVSAYVYMPLFWRLWLRPGARLSAKWVQAEMPYAVRIEEFDGRVTAEAALTFDGPILPTLSVGGGAIVRRSVLITRTPVSVSQDVVSSWGLLPVVYAQAGVGLPAWGGRLVFEPYGRYSLIFGDARETWSFGVEASLSLF